MKRLDDHDLRAAIVEAGRRMQALGFAAGSDGNLSARLPYGRILISPSGFSKGDLQPEMLLTLSAQGDLLPPTHEAQRGLRPSSEMALHLEAYRRRPDIGAVIHAHPPLAIACTLAGVSLAGEELPEIIYHLGAIPTAPYATPGTGESATVIRDLIADHDAIMLARHGSLTVGRDPMQALMRLEWVEQAARILLTVRQVTGQPAPPLDPDRVATLRALRGR